MMLSLVTAMENETNAIDNLRGKWGLLLMKGALGIAAGKCEPSAYLSADHSLSCTRSRMDVQDMLSQGIQWANREYAHNVGFC